MRASLKSVVLIGGLFFLAACETTAHYTSDTLGPSDSGRRILLMPTDIQLSELNAGGIKEPKADWTEKAEKLVTEALRQKLAEQNVKLGIYKGSLDALMPDSKEFQLVKLHGAIGQSILAHQYVPILALPTKKGKFKWTLGPDVAVLRERHDADYALFVFYRDSYASAGRAAVIVIGALFGVGIQGGTQIGFASLVNLRSGEIVWFNRLVQGSGDLRTAEPARSSVDTLLDSFPK